MTCRLFLQVSLRQLDRRPEKSVAGTRRGKDSSQEPCFADWVGSDPEALFATHGMRLLETEIAFLSRVMTFVR